MAELTEQVLEKAISNFKSENPEKVWEEVSQEVRWSYLDKAYPTDTTKVEPVAEAPVAEPVVEKSADEPTSEPVVETTPEVKPTEGN